MLQQDIEETPDEELQRCDPLLAVDDGTHVDSTGRRRQLIKNDRPEKVRRDVPLSLGRGSPLLGSEAPCFSKPLGDCIEVVKEQFPLAVLRPLVVTLERGNDVSPLQREDLLQRVGVGVHFHLRFFERS